jgi:two-component system, cell cycle response regulator
MTHILVVDDSYINRDLLRSTLEPLGYQVTLARTVEEGLALARQAPPDLILSDLHMPNQNGFTFITKLKSDSRLNRIPFAFLSSSVWGEKDRLEGLNLGAVRFILRPIEPQALLKEIEACLQSGSDGQPLDRKP